jgi:hypothetical protein
MRRAFLATLLALPAAALGQAAVGTINFDRSTINIVQCNGVQNPDANTSDSLNLGLTWQVQLSSSVPTFTTLGSYKVFAANQQLAAGVSTSLPISCTDPNVASSTFTVAQVGNTSYAATSQSVTSAQLISMSSIVSAVGYSCAVTSTTQTVYMCVQWYDATNTASGYAIGSVTLSLAQPAAPTITQVSGGDATLYVTASAGDSSTTHYKAKAWPVSAPDQVSYSNETAGSSGIAVSGLTNNQTYDVEVFGFNAANNPSPASAVATGTPEPTADFWTLYKANGGQESGGCNTAGAVGLLGALSLLALRRRKP